jgi:hypothetical protein
MAQKRLREIEIMEGVTYRVRRSRHLTTASAINHDKRIITLRPDTDAKEAEALERARVAIEVYIRRVPMRQPEWLVVGEHRLRIIYCLDTWQGATIDVQQGTLFIHEKVENKPALLRDVRVSLISDPPYSWTTQKQR